MSLENKLFLLFTKIELGATVKHKLFHFTLQATVHSTLTFLYKVQEGTLVGTDTLSRRYSFKTVSFMSADLNDFL